MKILITGKDKFTYNRTQVLLSGLSQLDCVELIYFPIINRKVFEKEAFTAISATVDLVYIPPFRHSDVKYIKKLSKAPVVFDALISKYLTRTIDHGKWWTAIEKKWRDRVAFKYSDVIVMDTEAHRQYIIDLYRLDENKVVSIPVGVDTTRFKPMSRNANHSFIVGFYGGFIPLQGVEKIVKAAHILRDHNDISFEIIGKWLDHKKVTSLAKKLGVRNIEFVGWVPYDELNDRINNYDLCLGIFGDSLKADLVVPNKLYHYAALGKVIITKDTVGVREIFENNQNAILIKGDAQNIANHILSAKKDPHQQLGTNALQLIQNNYAQNHIAECFVRKISLSLSR